MTEKEASEILCLCRDFSALDREHRKFALDVSQGLLNVQVPAASSQGNYRVISGNNSGGSSGKR